MTSEEKNASEVSLKDISAKERNIEIFNARAVSETSASRRKLRVVSKGL